jgi:hypothetical protein
LPGDVVEERLFASRRNLFSKLDLVFMDTTSLYFEGASLPGADDEFPNAGRRVRPSVYDLTQRI